MKTFIIINGLTATVVERESLEDARSTAINICDHSKEIIVREIECIINKGAVSSLPIF